MLFWDVVAGGFTTVTATGIKLYLSVVCVTVTDISSNVYQTARSHIQEDYTLQNTCSWLILNYELMRCEAVELVSEGTPASIFWVYVVGSYTGRGGP
jgi:hypothetical protein